MIPLDTAGLGDRSYLAHDGEVALAVDPQRDVDRITALANAAGVRITHVFESHIHNDYVTGGLALAGGINSWTATGGDLRSGRPVWELERQVRLVAGGLVLLSVLGSLVVPGLQWVAAFVGAGLSFAALTNTCAMGNVLARMPWNTRGGGTPIADLAAGR